MGAGARQGQVCVKSDEVYGCSEGSGSGYEVLVELSFEMYTLRREALGIILAGGDGLSYTICLGFRTGRAVKI